MADRHATKNCRCGLALIRASREMCRQCRVDLGKPPIDPQTYADQFGPYRRIRLTKGQYALVDIGDYEDIVSYNWCARFAPHTGTFYAVRKVKGEIGSRRFDVIMHKVIAGCELIPDHADGDTLNNRRYNLRAATPSQNSCNRRTRSNSVTGFKGVSWHKEKKVYRVRITVRGKTIQLGTTKTPREGALRYNEAAMLHHGEFARLNVV